MTSHHVARNRISVGVALAVLALLAGLATMGAASADPEVPNVQAVLHAAIDDAMDAGTYKEPGWTHGRLEAAKVAAMHKRLDDRLSEHMTGRALAGWKKALHTAIDRDSDGDHVVVTGGGVDRIQFQDVAVDGDTATATGRAHVWASWVIIKPGVPGPQKGRPAEWDTFAATLERVNGKWYVEAMRLKPESDYPLESPEPPGRP